MAHREIGGELSASEDSIDANKRHAELDLVFRAGLLDGGGEDLAAGYADMGVDTVIAEVQPAGIHAALGAAEIHPRLGIHRIDDRAVKSRGAGRKDVRHTSGNTEPGSCNHQ